MRNAFVAPRVPAIIECYVFKGGGRMLKKKKKKSRRVNGGGQGGGGGGGRDTKTADVTHSVLERI